MQDQEQEQQGGFAGSGVAGLDEVLCGGWRRGQIFLIHGGSGVGKTTLSLQFLMEGARRGERALYLGTSETEQELRQIAASHQWTLDGVTLHHQRPPYLKEAQTILHPSEVELPETMEKLLEVVDGVRPERLVIDSLAELRILSGDAFWYRRQLRKLKEYFAEKRCTVLLVEIPADHAPLNSVVHGVVELEQQSREYGPDRRRLRVVKIRGQEFGSGYHDYEIRTGGLEVFPRLRSAPYRRRFPRETVSTGLPRMDAMLGGGLLRGASTLLLGPSGTAKSLVATHAAVAAAQRGEKSVIYAFDERVQTLYQRAAGVGLPLEEFADQEMVEVRQIDPAELSVGEFGHLVREQVEVRGVRMLVLDSLNGYAFAMPDERLLSVHLHELSSYLNEQAITSVLTMTQHGLVDGRLIQPFDLSYLADIVLLFRHFEFGGEMHKAISVYKNRGGAHETSIRELKIGDDGLRMGEPLRQFHGILSGCPTYVGDHLGGTRGEA